MSTATASVIEAPTGARVRTPAEVAEALADACTTFPEVFDPDAALGGRSPKVWTHQRPVDQRELVVVIDGQAFVVRVDPAEYDEEEGYVRTME